MKRSRQEIEARREALTELLREKGYQPVPLLAQIFNVSQVTLRRDLLALEQDHQITRTHGGALVEDNQRLATFRIRVEQNKEQKREIALRTVEMLQSGTRIYLDGGTTLYAVAQELKSSGLQDLQVMTSSLPCAEMLSGVEGIRVYLTGGHLLPRHSMLVGDLSEASIAQWEFDLALLGAVGIDETGLWNSDEGLVRQQRSVIRRSAQVIYCLDPSKSNHSGPVFICRWDPRFLLISGA